MTQSAVSHQLRLLSEIVGERLVQKRGRGIELTPAGQALARKLQPAFAEIDRSLAGAIGGTRDRLRLAVCSSFAPGWLVPRLERFHAAHPQIDLQVIIYATDPELTDAVGDAFVTTLPKDRGYHAFFLYPERLVPVAPSGKCLGELPLITTDLKPGTIGMDWQTYGRESGKGVIDPPGGRWLQTSHYVTALQMVLRGLGAALLPDFLVQEDLEAGRIERIDDTAIATDEDYHLCIKESRRTEPALDALARWFRQEIDRSHRLGPKARLAVVQR